MEILRISIRTGLILSFAGLIIAVSYQLTPASEMRSTMAQAVSRPSPGSDEATPGGEHALRQVIADIRENRSIPGNSAFAASTRRTLSRDRRILTGLGPLQSMDYRGSDSEGDIYRTSFKNGSLTWKISMRQGSLESFRFLAPEGPYPQDWIDWYALLPIDNGISRFIFGLIKLSAIVALGLVAGLRL